MKKTNGFSLMEMMIVLLIVSIVAAASAPMINKKIVGIASEKSPWVWTGESQNITYNADGKIRTASIGVVNPPKDYFPRLFIKTPNANNPHLSLQATNEAPLNFTWNKNAIGITNAKIANNTNVAEGSIAIGKEANTLNNKSINSIAIGTGANTAHANSANSIAIGRSANTTTGNEAVAIGNYARALMPQSVAIGANAYVNESNSSGLQKRAIAIGYNARATHSDSIAIGGKWGSYPTEASNVASIAIGSTAVASGEYSMAIGGKSSSSTTAEASSTTTRAGGSVSMALGMQANAAGNNSVAIGHNAQVSNKYCDNSIAIGYNANATGNYGSASNSIAIGRDTHIGAFSSIAIGNRARTDTNGRAIAIGDNARTYFSDTIAIGNNANAWSFSSVAIGDNASANGRYSVAIGKNAKATATNSIVLGSNGTTVYIPGKLVIGNTTDWDTPAESWVLHVRGRSFLGPKKKTEGMVWTGSRDGWGKYYRDPENNDDDVKLSNSGSDRRLKNIGKQFVGGLEQLKKLPLYHFTYKKDEKKIPHVGVMAQDLQKVFPNAVSTREDGFLQIRHEEMFYALVNAVKELDAKIEALKNTEIATLRKQIQTLEKDNKALEKRLEALEKKIK